MIVFKMQALNCLSLKILTQNLIMSLIGEMQNVQNAKAEVSQFQNLNSESATVSVILSSTYNEMSHIAVQKL